MKRKPLIYQQYLVGTAGFEPTTLCPPGMSADTPKLLYSMGNMVAQ